MNFYGDQFRWFIGVTVANNDPLKLGRLRVRIYGIHSEDVNEVPENTLPWAQCVVPTTEDGVSGLGRAPGIKPGAMVFGIFLDGKLSQMPLILGSMPRIELPTEQQLGTVGEFPRGETTTFIPAGGHPYMTDIPQGGATARTEPLIGNTNTEKAFNFLVGNNFTEIQAAAILGNFIVESGMNPTIVSTVPGEDSFGIAQWNPAAGRLQQLQQWAADRKVDYRTLDAQLEFFIYDFSTIAPRFYGYNEFKDKTNLAEATRFFTDKYERPGTPHHSTRLAHAEEVLKEYGK